MRGLRPLTALVSGALLLQLVLAGGGFACVMPEGGGMRAAEASSMPGMTMSADAEGSVQSPSSDKAPCRLPWAPAGCQPMAPCAPAVVASAALVLAVPPTPIAEVATLVVLAPPSRSTPPELPPPRA